MKFIAIRAALEAGKIQKENYGKSLRIDNKQKFDYVTEIDKQCEHVIIDIIKRVFPDHRILAEETEKDEPGEYRWIIDPLDGTTNYIHSYPMFSVSIALEHNGQIIVGVIYDPLREELFVAELGKGAFLNDKPIHVSGTNSLSNSLILTGFPFRSKEKIKLYLESFRRIFAQVSDIRRDGSAALDFCSIACGRADGFWEIGLSPWDIAAGYLILTEAGGKMTNFFGDSLSVNSGNVVASNRLLHDFIVAEITSVFEGKIDI